jgi:2'-5' RNA ligase
MDPLIAVDVAILPPPAVARAAIDLSAALPAAESQGLRLDATHLPHITLTQQFVTVGAVPDVADAIDHVLAQCPPLRLAIAGPGRGSRSVWMQVDLTPALRDLHRGLMEALRPFERPGGGPSAFAGGDARPGDVIWVTHFRERSSDSRYTPHITLGHASRLPQVERQSFDAEVVALCHLGRFCSCRDILRSWTLIGPATHPHQVR